MSMFRTRPTSGSSTTLRESSGSRRRRPWSTSTSTATPRPGRFRSPWPTRPTTDASSLAIDAPLGARGVRPDIVVGHSVGEFSALGSAESLTVRDAVALLRERGIAMAAAAKAHPGSMAAILGLADEAVEALCHKIANVWPANYNCPGQLVISGETPSVDEACVEAEREGARRAIKLRVSGAFHSPLVARAAEALRPAVERVHLA